MKFQKLPNFLTGDDDLPQIHRIYNTSVFIATVFCLLAAVESALASLNPILIINNFLYSLILALLFYLSRFKRKFGVSRFLGVSFLLFIYTPILWIYNGGSTSGIPYYILLFFSFLTILTRSEDDTLKSKVLSGAVLIVYGAIIAALILLEFQRPDIFYKYNDPTARLVDTTISMLSAVAGNYFILRAFIEQYYKHLVEIKIYSKRLEELVVRDSMTGLYNHAHIISRLTDEIVKAARYQRPLSILMLDIDHFKKINDSFGHAFGDEVLTEVAHAIQSCCRIVDIAGRYGGEEFLIIFPETNSSSTMVVARRLQTTIQNLKFSHATSVTISGGITSYQSSDTTLNMIERVDTLLYEAKNEGRNRVNVAH